MVQLRYLAVQQDETLFAQQDPIRETQLFDLALWPHQSMGRGF